ncbi:hypothetical protein EG68_01374 [Paragonimus skrjabini miyazakii]|uniref:Uncharacterized protein n=1 Tax=Paragonimus skrjabini miyazakii TaxID=59628 RepID=A0A8S9Z1N2_9TREM|nr:hypothetical protein EG68_01374 [Paragonimus skrjabini miyazakii]
MTLCQEPENNQKYSILKLSVSQHSLINFAIHFACLPVCIFSRTDRHLLLRPRKLPKRLFIHYDHAGLADITS